MYAPHETIVHMTDLCTTLLVVSKGMVACRGRILRYTAMAYIVMACMVMASGPRTTLARRQSPSILIRL